MIKIKEERKENIKGIHINQQFVNLFIKQSVTQPDLSFIKEDIPSFGNEKYYTIFNKLG